MKRLDDKLAPITGGSSGIGLETATQFLMEGARVAPTGTNPVTPNAARKEFGDGAVIISSKAGDVAAKEALAQTVGSTFGQLDILVVNAGIVDRWPLAQWDEAGFLLIRVLLRVFANRAAVVIANSAKDHMLCRIRASAGHRKSGGNREGMVFFASNKAAFMAGSELAIDGGMINL